MNTVQYICTINFNLWVYLIEKTGKKKNSMT